MLTYSAQSLLITASKDGGAIGGFSYDASVAVFLAEFLKLLMTLAMMSPEVRSKLGLRPSLIAYAVPATLYALQNRLVFEILRSISPAEYQLLNNMKLFTTSIVYRVVMRRQLRVVQWLALALLAVGMALATQPQQDSANGSASANEGHDIWRGFAIMAIVAWLSAVAGVLNEWLIKKSPDPNEASAWLYVFCSLAAGLQMGSSGWGRLSRLEGFTATAWLVVLCNAVLGQSIAFLLRYADSIVKLYAVCAAMGFTAVVSVLVFGIELGSQVISGYCVVAISMCLYYAPTEVLGAPDGKFVADLCAGSRADTTAACAVTVEQSKADKKSK